MSVRVMSAVFDCFPEGGTCKLVLLCLANHANDQGENCYPSMAGIARTCRCSESQARRQVHALIESGYVSVEPGTEHGGGKSRRYRINLDRLTPSTHDTPSTDARGSTDARRPLAPMRATPSTHDTRTVINRPLTDKAAPSGASPGDPKEIVWTLGVSLLCRAGESEKAARNFLGKHAKGNESKLAEVIGYLAANPKVEPKAYIAKAMQPEKPRLAL